MRIGDPTPWGPAQHVTAHGPGVYFVSAENHGGFKVERALNAERIPRAIRAATFNTQGLLGWYEEDCDAAHVISAFPERFSAEQVAEARAAIAFWEKRRAEPATKETRPCLTD